MAVAIKPIATTLSPQRSVDLATGQPANTSYERSDFCQVPRAVPVAEAMLAIVVADALLEKLGGDSIEELDEVETVLPRVTDVLNSYLRALELDDLRDPLALTRLRAQMLRRIQVVVGKERVRDLLIMEFVLN